MNRQLTITALVLLLIGAGAIAVIKTKNPASPSSAGANPAGSPADPGDPTGASAGAGTGSSGKSASRQPREIHDAELAERYGESKTRLSRHVAGNVVSLLEDAIAMGEMMSKGAMAGNFGGGRMASRMALRGIDIELTEEQNEKVTELYGAFRLRELEKSKKAVQSLKGDSSALMELFLAGDAKSREDMTEAEYEAVVSSAADDLTGVINPLDRNNFRGGNPMEDEIFRREFEGILDEDQATTLDTSLAEREANADPSTENDGNITKLPTMELETLDEAVSSAQKMTSGFKQVMEGMGSLQELRPKMEPESQGE